jgi:hypothetical protein
MLLVLIFTWGCVDPRAMARSEGNMSLKNPVTPPGIDPGTVRIVAQRLNHYANAGILADRDNKSGVNADFVNANSWIAVAVRRV